MFELSEAEGCILIYRGQTRLYRSKIYNDPFLSQGTKTVAQWGQKCNLEKCLE